MGVGIKTNLSSISSWFNNGDTASTNQTETTAFDRLANSVKNNAAKTTEKTPTTLEAQNIDFSTSIKNANRVLGALNSADSTVSSQEKIIEKIKAKANFATQDGTTSSEIEQIRKDIESLVNKLDNTSTTPSDTTLSLLGQTFYGQQYLNQNNSTIGSTANNLGNLSVQSLDSISTTGNLSLQFINQNGTVTNFDSATISDSASSNLASLAQDINSTSQNTGISASFMASSTSIDTISAGSVKGLVLNGVTIGNIDNIQNSDSDGTLVNTINSYKDQTGVLASVGSDGRLTLSSNTNSINVSSASTTTTVTTPNTSDTYYSVSKVNSQGIATHYVNLNSGDEVSASQIDANSEYVNNYYKIGGLFYINGQNGTFAGLSAPTNESNPYVSNISINYGYETRDGRNRDKYFRRYGQATSFDDTSTAGNDKLSAKDIKTKLNETTTSTTTVNGDIETLGFGENGFTNYGSLELQNSSATKVVAKMNGSDVKLDESNYSLATMSAILSDWSSGSTGSASLALEVATNSLNEVSSMKSSLSSNISTVQSQIDSYYKMQSSLSPANSIVPPVDYAVESANFDKNSVLTKSGSLLSAQSLVTQDSVSKLLFGMPQDIFMLGNDLLNAHSFSSAAKTNWHLLA